MGFVSVLWFCSRSVWVLVYLCCGQGTVRVRKTSLPLLLTKPSIEASKLYRLFSQRSHLHELYMHAFSFRILLCLAECMCSPFFFFFFLAVGGREISCVATL